MEKKTHHEKCIVLFLNTNSDRLRVLFGKLTLVMISLLTLSFCSVEVIKAVDESLELSFS